MKITVEANDFCPDNCPFCSLKERLIKDVNGRFYTAYNCEHEAICENAFEIFKGRLKDLINKPKSEVTEND